MAAFQRILHLIVVSAFVLPGLSLSPLPSVTPIWIPPFPTRLHLADQKQLQYLISPTRKLESEVNEGLGQHSGKADMEGLELYGERADGNSGGGYTEQVTPVGGGYRHLLEGPKGQRWVKGKWGGHDATVRGKSADASTVLLKQRKYDSETGSWEKYGNRGWNDNKMSILGKTAESDKGKRKWGDNSMRVWGKRAGIGTEKRKWGDNSMNLWGKRASTEIDNGRSDDKGTNTWGKGSEDNDEKRKWGDNSMSVWGKRSDGDKMTSDYIRSSGGTEEMGTSGESKEAAGVDSINPSVKQSPSWVKQTKVDIAKDTGSGHGHRILNKRSLADHEEYLVENPRYDWLVEELSKRNRPRWNSREKQYGGPKRNWETNTMKVWGKRGLAWETIPNWNHHSDEEREDLDGKRSWTSDNAIRIWGKRNGQTEAHEIWKDLLDSYES